MKKLFSKASFENVALLLLSGLIVLLQTKRIWPTWDSVWLDEILTVSVASAPTLTDLLRDSLIDGIPLGYYFFQFLIFKIGGFHLLKILSILVAIFALYKLLKLLYYKFTPASTAIAAFLILQTDYLAIYFIELRSYGFLFIFVLVSLLLLQKVLNLRSFSNKTGIYYILLSTLGVSFHYTYALVVFTQMLTCGIFFKRNWYKPILVGCIIALLSTPFFFRFYQMMDTGYNLWSFIQKPTGKLVYDLQDILNRIFENQYTGKEVLIFSTLFIFSCLILYIKKEKIHAQKSLVFQLLAGAIFTPAILYIISLNFQSLMIARYFYYMFICFIAIISIAFGSIIPRKLSHFFCICTLVTGLLVQPKIHAYYNDRENTEKLLQTAGLLDNPCFITTFEGEQKFARGLRYLTNHLNSPTANSMMSANLIEESCKEATHMMIVTFYPYPPYTQNLKEYFDKNLGNSTFQRVNSTSIEYWKK